MISAFKEHLAACGRTDPRVLLIFGSPTDNGLGDWAIGTRHCFSLRYAFPNLQLTVHSHETAVWHAFCGPAVRCSPILSRAMIVSDSDLIVFDNACVESVAAELERSAALVLDLPPLGDSCRYKFSRAAWCDLMLPPLTNRPHRIFEMYEALGFGPQRYWPGRAARSTGSVFLNPYASFGRKCLSPTFLDALLERLPEACRAIPIIAPAPPSSIPDGDAPLYERLHRLLAAAADRGRMTMLPPMGRAAYVETIASAALVIGPDTSTQHVAAASATPSIACYVPEAGYWYNFWGSLGPDNLCFRIPGRKASQQVRSLADLVSLLASIFLRGQPARRAPRPLNTREFLAVCERIARREIDAFEGERALDAFEARVRKASSFTPRSPSSQRQAAIKYCFLARVRSGVITHESFAVRRSAPENIASKSADPHWLRAPGDALYRVPSGVPSRNGNYCTLSRFRH